MVKNKLLGIIPTNSGWDIQFNNPERTTNGIIETQANSALFTQSIQGSAIVTWTLPDLYNISTLIFNANYYKGNAGSWTLDYYNGSMWINIDGDSMVTGNSLVFSKNQIYQIASLASDFRFISNKTEAPGFMNLYVMEIQVFQITPEFIVQDTTDDYSQSEHNSWGVRAGLPLPKALRAWK